MTDPTLMQMANAYAKRRASRPNGKAEMAANTTYSVAAHVGNDPAGERSARSLDEAKAYAKAMLAAVKAQAKGKPVVVDVYPVVNYEPKPAVLTLRASRPGAKAEMDKNRDYIEYAGLREKISKLMTRVARAKGPELVKLQGELDAATKRFAELRDSLKSSRPGAKARMAKRYDAKIVGNELVRSDGRRYQIKGRKPSLPKAREINGEVEWLFITGENGAEYSVQRFDDSGYRVFGGSSGMSVQWDGLLRASRPGAKAKMGAAEVRKAQADLAKAKKELEDALKRHAEMNAILDKVAKGEKSTHAQLPDQTLEAARQPGGGAHSEAVSRKIKKLIDEGKPQDQAVAIALDLERRGEL